MWKHEAVWGAIDALAERQGLSASGLARKAGLDATSFNRSKRHGGDGRPRWPSTESIAKILAATGETLEGFLGLARPGRRPAPVLARATAPLRTVPLLGLAQAGGGGFFDDAGFPAGQGWDLIELPATAGEGSYALQVQGDSMLPLYRHGDMLVVQPNAVVRKGDRVVVKTIAGEVMAKVLEKRTASAIELVSLNPDHPHRRLAVGEVEWLARIVWASQ